MRRAAAAALLAAGLLGGAAASSPPRVPASGGSESAPVRSVDGAAAIGANDLARLLGATKYWRSDVRQLVLRVRDHRLVLTADNPFVLIDDRTVRLPQPVRPRRGELQVPVAIVDALPVDTTLARLVVDRRRARVVQVPPAGLVRGPRIVVEEGVTRVVFDVERSDEARISARARDRFRIVLGGLFAGGLPDSLPGAGLVRALRSLGPGPPAAFELALDPAAGGYRVVREPERRRVTLVVARAPAAGLEPFAFEPPPARMRTIVLDPGHGGGDAGVTAGGVAEKDLTLALARLVRAEAGRRLAARVVLVREDDRDLGRDERAERANRERPDLVVSLHFDGLAAPESRGATAYCPPATTAGEAGAAAGAAIEVLPWRDAALRHAVPSRRLAEHLLAALERRSAGPSRLRELLPYPLLGVDAPGVLLECATLTAASDRARVTGPQGLHEIAAAIVDGLEAYQADRWDAR